MKTTTYFLGVCLILLTACKNPTKLADPVTRSTEYQSWEETTQPKGSPSYLAMGSYAKVLCSAVFVSGRDIDEAAVNSKMNLFSQEGVETKYSLDEEKKQVKVWIEGDTSRSATFYGDQGCIIDREEGINFDPVEVKSALGPAEEISWPMGDQLSEDMPEINASTYQVVLDSAFDEKAYTAAFLVIKDGQIILEKYGQGAHKDMQLESWSMGKSLTATLIGRLIQQGELSLEQKAPVEEWQAEGDPRAEISIRNLLNMSSGLRFAAHRDPDRTIPLIMLPHIYIYMEALDVFDFSINRPLEYVPGSTGRYRNCDPLTLGKIIRDKVEAKGENYHQWPQKVLFDKVGIRKQVLETDINGNFIMTGFDYATARNWGRIAMLYLQDGMWEGERLLPEGYSDFVSTPGPGWNPPEYGGLFWLNTTGRWKDLPENAYFMGGGGGQRVIISPSDNLAIIRMGHSRGERYSDAALNAAITELMKLLKAEI
ncbi:MAG: serine hydrolase [Bacteroidota bacterium]